MARLSKSYIVIIDSEFRPPWWLSNPHAQTILSSKFARVPEIPTSSLRLELNDGDFLDISSIDKLLPEAHRRLADSDDNKPVVALFHGLAGSVHSAYIQGAFSELRARGFRPVLMHWRGCSGQPNRLARSYHSGASDDIDWFVRWLRIQFPQSRLYALGYSLGANALLKYLGEQANSELHGAVAVCPPLQLSVGADTLNTGIARGYQRYLLNLMRQQHEAKRSLYPDLKLPAAGPELNTFWKFDDVITAPLHDYDGVHDYYNKCSARQFLPAITRHTRILFAADDPFFTTAVLPQACELAANTTLEVSAHGGHVGFLQSGKSKRWLDSHVANVIAQFDS